MQKTDKFINNDMTVQSEIRDTYLLTAEMFAGKSRVWALTERTVLTAVQLQAPLYMCMYNHTHTYIYKYIHTRAVQLITCDSHAHLNSKAEATEVCNSFYFRIVTYFREKQNTEWGK